MDTNEFAESLATAIAAELCSRLSEYSSYTMAAFDLGIHPWHGTIELSFMTTHDACSEKRIGDWKLYNFADTPHSKWPLGVELMKWAKEYYDADPSKNLNRLLELGAQSLRHDLVRSALGQFHLAQGFFVSVYNPDDRSFFNYCA